MRSYLLLATLVLFSFGLIVSEEQSEGLAASRQKARELAEKKIALEQKKSWSEVGGATKIKALKEARRTLEEIQAKQAKRYGIAETPVIPFAEKVGTAHEEDKFIQSEAHVYSSEIRKLIQQNFDIIPHLNVISTCVSREAGLSKTHDVFYHALNNEWLLTQDLEKQLYTFFNASEEIAEDFIPLRSSVGESTTARDFLIMQLKEQGNVDDTLSSNKGFLLSTNLAIFGNVDWPYECTWNYFMKPSSREPFRAQFIEAILDKYGLSHTYVNELISLVDILRRSSTESLLQIFIPRGLVDEIAYVAWVKGIPAHQKTIKWIMGHSRNVHDPRYAINKLTSMFAEKQQESQLFKDTIKDIEEGGFGVRDTMDLYRNKPWEVENINLLQARLIITNEILLNKNSGVKFYRYSTLGRKDLKEYHTKLQEIVEKMVNEKMDQSNG